jgi:hypothetical protein
MVLRLVRLLAGRSVAFISEESALCAVLDKTPIAPWLANVLPPATLFGEVCAAYAVISRFLT